MGGRAYSRGALRVIGDEDWAHDLVGLVHNSRLNLLWHLQTQPNTLAYILQANDVTRVKFPLARWGDHSGAR